MRNLSVSKKQVLILILILVIVGLIIDLNTRISSLTALRDQEQTLSADVSHLQVTLENAEERINYADSETAVEEWAREQGLMMQPEDYVIIPISSGKPTPTPTVIPTPITTPVENWEIWKSLIF